MLRLRSLLGSLILVWGLMACGGGGGSPPAPAEDGEPPAPMPFQRVLSAHETDAPYLGDPAFWSRSDLYIMRPDVEPLDRWPDEVCHPDAHGLRILVFLPGDYRGRSNGSLGDGTLLVEASGTAAEPILITYAPSEGADLRQTPHPAERIGQDEARLVGIRVVGQQHQWFRGLTFRDGFAASLLHGAPHCTIDRCLWHDTQFQPLRIRFGSHHVRVLRSVFQRFDRTQWGNGDTVAIQVSDGACTHIQVLSNVILNWTDSYQHTDRDGEPYGLGAGTIIDNNILGFTSEAHVQAPNGELMCGENSIDMKMGGTELEPVRITNNVFFGTRAAEAGCAASGSGGYAVTVHRRGTWIEFEGNRFLDCDSGIFLNAFFQDVDPAQGRIDPHITLTENVFSGIRSFSTAFPSRTGRVMSGTSPALFRDNTILVTERLMEREPVPGVGDLVIQDNRMDGPLVLDPRTQAQLEADGNTFTTSEGTEQVLVFPWVGRSLTWTAP